MAPEPHWSAAHPVTPSDEGVAVIAISDPTDQPSSSGPARHEVSIEAYVRMSFNDEIELTGTIGGYPFTAASRTTFRAIEVRGQVGDLPAALRIGRRRLRSLPVIGQVMGQPVTGLVDPRGPALTFTGRAGEEELSYRLDTAGSCTNFGRDLGVRVVAQPFYSEIAGTVERIPDAAMIGLLLPVRLARQEDAYS